MSTHYPRRIAQGPNGEPMTNPDGKPATYAALLHVVLTSTSPEQSDRIATYRILQMIASQPEEPSADAAPIDFSIEQLALMKKLTLQCTALTTVAFGVLHDWLEGKSEPH